jgi:HlyD family secretion protein
MAQNEPPQDLMKQIGKPRPRGWRRVLRWTVIGLVVAGLGVAVFLQVRRPPTPPTYASTPLARGDLAATISATGALRGQDTVAVGAETSGRVSAVHADFNAIVHADQVLVEIDPAQHKAALRQSEAQLLAARAEVKSREASLIEARQAVERTRGMTADGLTSKQALETAEAAARRADAAVAAAQAQVAVAQADVSSRRTALEKTQIKSPLDGVVLSREVEPGQTLAAGMTTPVVFRIARDLRQMEVTIAIDEADVGRAKVGQKATFTVDAWPGRTFPGVLHDIHNVAVTKDNVVTYEALLRVSNDDLLLRPGMTATVSIQTESRTGVLRVPNAALRFAPPSNQRRSMLDGPPKDTSGADHGGKPRVWRVKAGPPQSLEPIEVTVGLTDGEQTEITAPLLAEGDLIATDVLGEALP